MKLSDYFKPIDRQPDLPGTRVVTLTDAAPQWLRDAVHEAHGGGSDLPCDWIYGECAAACQRIDDGVDDDEDWIHEHADSRVDVYTRDLYAWAAYMCHSTVYADAQGRAEDYGGATVDPEKTIAVLQYCAVASIAETIFQAWKDRDDESE